MLKKVLSNNDETIDFLRNIQSNLSEINILIPNIGISYNNKVIEFFYTFKDKEIDFNKSKLVPVIINYFNDLVCTAINALDSFTDSYNKFSRSRRNRRHYYLEAMLYIKIYKKIDKLLYNFDIKKDIIEAIHDNIIRKNATEECFSDYNELINIYKDELMKFDISLDISEMEKLNSKELKLTFKL